MTPQMVNAYYNPASMKSSFRLRFSNRRSSTRARGGRQLRRHRRGDRHETARLRRPGIEVFEGTGKLADCGKRRTARPSKSARHAHRTVRRALAKLTPTLTERRTHRRRDSRPRVLDRLEGLPALLKRRGVTGHRCLAVRSASSSLGPDVRLKREKKRWSRLLAVSTRTAR